MFLNASYPKVICCCTKHKSVLILKCFDHTWDLRFRLFVNARFAKLISLKEFSGSSDTNYDSFKLHWKPQLIVEYYLHWTTGQNIFFR
jgi:hypothetical protein